MSNQVEIDVVLSGAEEASRGLNGIGETAGQMAERFSDENGKLGEGLGELAGNVEGLVGSFKEFGQVATTVGKGSKMSFMALVPAIGAVVGAGFALYETYLNISGAAEDAEKTTEAMAAAASDLESKLEALAEKGVIPATEALDDFIRSNIKAQFSKEMLQTAVEKLRDEFEDLHDAEQAVEAAREGQESFVDVLRASVAGVSALKVAQDDLADATKAYDKKLDSLQKLHAKHLPKLDESAKKEKALEEQSAESTLGRIREAIALENTLELRKAEINLVGTKLKVRQIEINANKEANLIKAKANEEDAKALTLQEENLKKQIAKFNQLDQLDALREVQIKRARDADNKSSKRAIKQVDTRRIRELAIERQKQADLKKLRQLELQRMAFDGASALKLASERYDDELKAAGENETSKLVAYKRFTLEMSRIQKAESDKADAEKQRQKALDDELAKHKKVLALDTLQFNLEMQTREASLVDELPLFGDLSLMQSETEQRLQLLTVRYDQERALNAQTQKEITELDRREAIERTRINQESTRAMIDQIGEFSAQYAGGLAEAEYASLLFGDSFSESVGDVLIALGKQASVEALMQFAKGTAALFTEPQLAGNHFAAGGMFLAAAGVAGITGKSLGGGGGASGAGASPSGAPSVAPMPQREQAEQAPMVFNINFGGAVIYDTKQSAEQAFADRITSLQNTRRRGGARRF